jgi:two-component system, LuxR family, sensor kinase FixL
MQTTEENTLNLPIEMESSTSARFDLNYWIVIFFSVVMIFFVIAQIFDFLQNDNVTLVGNSLKTIIGIVGVIMSYSVTKSLEGNLKHTWKILTAAYIFNTGGDTIWYYYASILGEKPFPSWADVSFLIHYPVMLWALLSYPTKLQNLDKKKFAADLSIVMVSGVTIVWYFIIHPTISAITADDLVSPALNLSYTVGDMVLILGIFAVFFRGVEENLKRALQIIVAGVICMLVADLGFAYLTLQGTYFGGHWIENFFIFNSLSHIYAAYYQKRKSLRESENDEIQKDIPKSKLLNLFPYIAVLLGMGLLLWEAKPYFGEPLGKIIISTIILTGLVVIRQIIAVRENARLLSERAAHQQEIRFQSLVQNSSDMISILNLDGTIQYESPSVKNVLGYEIDELVGKKFVELIHPEDLNLRKKLFENLIANPQSLIQNEVRFKHKDGSWRVLETIAKKLDDEANNLKGILINSRDITQRKQSEEKLRIYTTKLEQSNRELEDFAYVASHDLQEPLRKVQAFGDRLQTKCGDVLRDEGNDYVRRMRDAAGRMQNLINDLLTFSRVASKAQPFKAVDISAIAREVVSDLEVRIEQTKGIVEIGDLPVIDADPSQMRQLLQNLIGNALKFHRTEESPVIKIYAESFAQTGASFLIDGKEVETIGNSDKVCKIIVQDNGIGFEEKYLDKIFTVFQRLHGRAAYEGSGIGLAVCRKIAERHGGAITAKSEPNQGATFFVTLPLSQIEKEMSINEKGI